MSALRLVMTLLEKDSNKELKRESKEFGTSNDQQPLLPIATATKDYPNTSPPCVAQYTAFATPQVGMFHCGADTIFKQGRKILLVSSLSFEKILEDGQQIECQHSAQSVSCAVLPSDSCVQPAVRQL